MRIKINLGEALESIRNAAPLPVDNMKDHRPRRGIRFTERDVENRQRADEDPNNVLKHPTIRVKYLRLDDGD